jgi:glucose-6-phosphate isomerase
MTARGCISSPMSMARILPTHLSGLDPETTLIIVASKTFTTIETMTNAARRGIHRLQLGEAAVAKHFAAFPPRSTRWPFGLDARPAFSVSGTGSGGRYSLWSAIGLPLMIAIGKPVWRFPGRRAGHGRAFQVRAGRENLPMLLGLLGVWHRLVCGYPSRAIIPYDQRLSRFPAYLQQLDMESNGKSVGSTASRSRPHRRDRLSGASPEPTASTRSSSCCIRAPT